jgi:nucleotide-binding universal stress UspA family protein
MLKEILLHQPGGTPDPALAYALALAAEHGARVTLLAYPIETAGALAWGAADLPLDGPEEDGRLQAAAQDAAARAGVALEIAPPRSFAYGIGETLADWARVRDLTVLGAAGGPGIGRRFLWRAAVFDSGRPVLLVPEAAAPAAPRRVLVAWDASRAAVRAANDALPLLAAAEVTVISVTDDKAFRPGQSAVEMTRHLARHGIAANFREIRREGRPVSAAIGDALREQRADLLVMGAHAHSGLRELVLGSATGAAFAGAWPVPLLLSH